MTVAGVCAGALGVGLLLPARSRGVLLGGLGLVAVGIVLMALAFAGELGRVEQVAVPSSPAVLAGAVLVVAALGGLAALLVRFPGAVVPLLLLAAPFRPPLDPDPAAPLLVTLRPDALVGYHLPLYAALGGAALALAWRVARGERVHALPRRLAWPGTALIVLVTLSVLWSADREEGINQVLLFWLPFAMLVAVVAHAPVREWTPRALGWVAVGLGCVFALVGLVQVAVGEIFFSTSALAEANATTELFRVTSLFQDPSIYGRHLVVAMAVVLVALWLARLRLALGLSLLALLGAALFFTYSQSSLLSLAAVALGIAVVAGDRRTRLAVTAAVVLAAVTGVATLGVALSSGSASELTRNRSTLVGDTALVFLHHPVAGVGVGGQPVATRREGGGGDTLGRSTSHTTPLTIAADLGLLGLVAYLALLAGAGHLLLELHRRDPALALGLGAVLAVLFVHALIYEGFFETALGWGAIAVAGAAVRGNARGGAAGTAAPRGGGRRPVEVAAT